MRRDPGSVTRSLILLVASVTVLGNGWFGDWNSTKVHQLKLDKGLDMAWLKQPINCEAQGLKMGSSCLKGPEKQALSDVPEHLQNIFAGLTRHIRGPESRT